MFFLIFFLFFIQIAQIYNNLVDLINNSLIHFQNYLNKIKNQNMVIFMIESKSIEWIC